MYTDVNPGYTYQTLLKEQSFRNRISVDVSETKVYSIIHVQGFCSWTTEILCITSDHICISNVLILKVYYYYLYVMTHHQLFQPRSQLVGPKFRDDTVHNEHVEARPLSCKDME